MSSASIEPFETYGSKLLCLEKTDDIKVQGNYDSNEASQLMVVFEKFDRRARYKKGLRCKTDAEIDEWL